MRTFSSIDQNRGLFAITEIAFNLDNSEHQPLWRSTSFEGIFSYLIGTKLNAALSIVWSCEVSGISIWTRVRRNEKAHSQITVKLEGIVMLAIDVPENAHFPIVWSSESFSNSIVSSSLHSLKQKAPMCFTNFGIVTVLTSCEQKTKMSNFETNNGKWCIKELFIGIFNIIINQQLTILPWL